MKQIKSFAAGEVPGHPDVVVLELEAFNGVKEWYATDRESLKAISDELAQELARTERSPVLQ